MKKISICDISLRESGYGAAGLSFKEKIEVARLLARLGVDTIETGYIGEAAADAVLVRTLSATVEDVTLSVPVTPEHAAIERAWSALSRAKRARLNLIVPTSTVQMEYIYQIKADQMLQSVEAAIAKCAALCGEVEFTAEDATRAEPGFLASLVKTAIAAGAKIVTLADSTGEHSPDEIAAFIERVRHEVPQLCDVTTAVLLNNSLGLAAASALAAIAAGAAEIKVSAGSAGCLPLGQFLSVLKARGEAMQLRYSADVTMMQRVCRQIGTMIGQTRTGTSAFDRVVGGDAPGDEALAQDADINAVAERIGLLGYEVSGEDLERVWAQIHKVAQSKPVYNRDIEAIIAETAGQVPAAYELIHYVINSGSDITATSLVRVSRQGAVQQALSAGDGPIDASFLAIEQIVGRHYELDDFQIAAVTEGREAMGSALVKLRSGGKLYSGRGLSTDIIGASVKAYLSAVNKIVYEEKGI